MRGLSSRGGLLGVSDMRGRPRCSLSVRVLVDEHVEVEATWAVYQAMIASYQESAAGFPLPLSEVFTLGRTLTGRAGDILAYYDRPGTSNTDGGPQWPARAAPRHRPRLPQT